VKRIIWEKKKSLKGSKIWIDEDWTWREREVRRKLGRLAVEERGKRRRVWVEGNRIRIEGEWRRWNEEKGELESEKGTEREGEKSDRKNAGEGEEGRRWERKK